MDILIVEDESVVAMEIESYLMEEGYMNIGIASNGEDGYKKAIESQPNVVLMDINLESSLDGIQTAKNIQKERDIPIIYLTAFADDETIERAIQTNPAAYLVKPFNRRELLAGVKIALRSKQKIQFPQVGIIMNHEFSYDLDNQQLLYCGEFIHLTKRERQLLYLLITSKNKIVSVELMEHQIWPDKAPNENTRRSLINRLRAKLKHQFIETIPSVGYRMVF